VRPISADVYAQETLLTLLAADGIMRCQRNSQSAPEYTEHSCGLNKDNGILWTSYVRLPIDNEPIFPQPADYTPYFARPPGFTRKITARNYAAMCATRWLLAEGILDREFVEASPSASKIPIPLQSPLATTGRSQPPEPLSPTFSSSSSSYSPSSSQSYYRPPSPTRKNPLQDLQVICTRIGFMFPDIIVDNRGGLFDARADFRGDTGRVPEDIGRVAGMPTHAVAREMSASLVLAFMKGIESQRTQSANDLLASV
jgi:hypothetical protein